MALRLAGPSSEILARVHICVLDDLEAAALAAADWTPMTALGELVVVNRHVDRDELVELLQPFDVVVAMRERTRFPRSLLTRLPQLRLLVTTGARNAAIDLATCAERGIVVSGTTGGGSPVVELAWALILATVRDLPGRVVSMRAGEWQPMVGSELEGRTLGLLGLGHTGGRMARIATAFGMEVLAWSPHLAPERAAGHRARYVDKDGCSGVPPRLVAPGALRPDPGHRRGTRAVGHAADLVAGQRQPGPVVRRAGPAAGVRRGLDRRRLRWMSTQRSRCPPSTRCGASLAHCSPRTSGTSPGSPTGGGDGDVVEDIVSFAGGAPLRVLNG